MNIAKNITVHGNVQGVGFRYYTLECARMHGIYGWVRNTSAGTVEIHGEGSDKNLDAFLHAIEKGTAFSKVQNIDVRISDFHAHKDFRIRY